MTVKEQIGRLTKPLVSVILLNWNGERHVHRCLEHVAAQTYSPIEVIVVDNGSSDGSIQKIKAQYPDHLYVENARNLGFATGMNQGFRVARGEYVLPLN